jgi:hypothetical protein
MGVLSALGRSGALRRNTQNLAQLAVSLRQLRNQEIRDERNYAISSRRLELAESADVRGAEVAEREATKFKWAKEEQARKDKWGNAVTPVDQFLQNSPPKTAEALRKWGKENAYITETGGVEVISNYGKLAAKKHLDENLSQAKQFSDIHLRELTEMIVEIDRKMANTGEEKLSPKELEALAERKKVLQTQRTQAVNANLAIDKAHQAKLAEQKSKAGIDAEAALTEHIRELEKIAARVKGRIQAARIKKSEEVKISTAVDRYTAAKKAIASLKSTGAIPQELLINFPALAALVGGMDTEEGIKALEGKAKFYWDQMGSTGQAYFAEDEETPEDNIVYISGPDEVPENAIKVGEE